MKSCARTLSPLIVTMLFGLSPMASSEPVGVDTKQEQTAGLQQEQQPEPEKTELQELAEKAAMEIGALERLAGETEKLAADIKQATNEEQSMLRGQLRRTQAEMRGSLNNLVETIAALEVKEQDVQEARQTASRFAARVSEQLKGQIDDSMKFLAILDEKVKTASQDEAPEIRQQIRVEREAVDDELAALLKNSDLLEVLGMKSAPDLKYIDETLVQRAENLVARLQYLVDQRKGLKQESKGLGEEEKKKIAEKVAGLDGRISATSENLKFTIALMNDRKLDAAQYKQVLISSTGEITKDVFEKDVAIGLLNLAIENGRAWLLNEGPKWGFKLIIFFLILFVFALLSKIVKSLSRRALASARIKASVLLQELFVSMIGKIIFFAGILIALAQVGIQVGPVLAGLGIVGFIIGFALQETLSNFASGVMILIYKPFDVGDSIEAGGVTGKVKHMSLVSTTITTFDNQRVIVPNRKIWGDVIRNVNAEKIRRIDMTFGIGYDDDPELAERVLRDIVEGYELVLEAPEPVIQLHNLGESTVDFIVRPWVKADDYWTAYWYITRQVKKRFDEEGISIPFPQQDMHVYHHGNSDREQYFPGRPGE